MIENLKAKILLEEEDKGEEYDDKINEEIEIKEDIDQQSEEIIEETLEENTEEQVELNKKKRNDEENHENERERVKRKKIKLKGFKRILGELRNKTYEIEIEEENDKERLSERVLSIERKTIKYCYEIRKDVTNEVQRIKEQEKRKIKERKKKNGVTVEDISKEMKIEENKMKRIIKSMITDFEKLKNEEIDKIIEEFNEE
ncbi:hypothetical protein C1645_814491 [Glomus cerebriforme]|uniref:Uncharacterized protein n=1 Tax=Glomus cerebriforme TaxID=658196 RepID=A0A397TFT5_9GLOM|nr:hypothetical protein C1645_814491 [Glomus cerebriforme]